MKRIGGSVYNRRGQLHEHGGIEMHNGSEMERIARCQFGPVPKGSHLDHFWVLPKIPFALAHANQSISGGLQGGILALINVVHALHGHDMAVNGVKDGQLWRVHGGREGTVDTGSPFVHRINVEAMEILEGLVLEKDVSA